MALMFWFTQTTLDAGMTHAALGFRNPEVHVLYGLAADSDLTSVLSWSRENCHGGAYLVH